MHLGCTRRLCLMIPVGTLGATWPPLLLVGTAPDSRAMRWVQTEAPIWHPCSAHQASLWAQALAAATSAPAVRTSLKAELGGRSDRIGTGQEPEGAEAPADPAAAPAWRSSWEGFVGTTKEQLVSWAQSVAAAQVWGTVLMCCWCVVTAGS